VLETNFKGKFLKQLSDAYTSITECDQTQFAQTVEFFLPKLSNFFYPPVTENIEDSAKIKTAIYVHDNLDYKMCVPPVPSNNLSEA